MAVSGGGAVAVAVAVAGLTKRFFNHIQKDFLINVPNQDVRISIFNVIRTKWQGYWLQRILAPILTKNLQTDKKLIDRKRFRPTNFSTAIS